MNYHKIPINEINPSLFYDEIDKLKLDGNNKFKKTNDEDMKYEDYDVTKNNKICNYERLLLVNSLAIALEQKNVSILFSLSHLKTLMSTHVHFLHDYHFAHVNNDGKGMIISNATKDDSVKTSTDNRITGESKKQTIAVNGTLNSSNRRLKNQTKLSNGAILIEYVKNYNNLAVSISKASRNDIEGLYYIRANKMNLNHSLINIVTSTMPFKIEESRERVILDDYVLINVTQMKHLFLNVNSYMCSVWEDDKFILLPPSLEREITSEVLNDIKLGQYTALIEVSIGHGQRILIDVVVTNHESLKKILTKPYEDRIQEYRLFFGPKWTVPQRIETVMDSHNAYVQIPRHNLQYADSEDTEKAHTTRYYHNKPMHTVCAFGLCGNDVLIAYHRNDSEYEYKLSVPNNTNLNLMFMATSFNSLKSAYKCNSDVCYKDDIVTYANDSNFKIFELNQIITIENKNSIKLFKKPIRVTICDITKLGSFTNLPYTNVSEFRPPQARENAVSIRKRSYFENAIVSCSENELKDHLMKRFKTSGDLEKFLRQTMTC